MRVTVIGAGVVGVCTAWSLAEAGCEVTVIERNRGVAQETSYGNAGLVAPAYVTPWAAPGMPLKILSMLFAHDTPVRFSPTLDPALWRWVGRWLHECRVARFKRNKARMQRLAFYSRDCLASLRTGHGLWYERTEGMLQLLRSERDAKMAATTMAFLKEAGVTHQLLSPAECRVREPGLSDIAFVGGLFLPDVETGNCPLFTRQLKDLCEERGVRFEFGSAVLRVTTRGDAVSLRVRNGSGDSDRAVDAVVIAGGVDSTMLLRRLGIRLPLYPIKGYSATVAIREPTYAPIAAVMDEAYKVAIVRMGNRIRVAGTAELGDRDLSITSANAERAL
ncbi:MAG: FAD-dependent oxidoreductase, partial [Burkholderiaceae bacterium]